MIQIHFGLSCVNISQTTFLPYNEIIRENNFSFGTGKNNHTIIKGINCTTNIYFEIESNVIYTASAGF